MELYLVYCDIQPFYTFTRTLAPDRRAPRFAFLAQSWAAHPSHPWSPVRSPVHHGEGREEGRAGSPSAPAELLPKHLVCPVEHLHKSMPGTGHEAERYMCRKASLHWTTGSGHQASWRLIAGRAWRWRPGGLCRNHFLRELFPEVCALVTQV